jgi:hypothetical protein
MSAIFLSLAKISYHLCRNGISWRQYRINGNIVMAKEMASVGMWHQWRS